MDEHQLSQAHPQELRHLADGAVPVYVAANALTELGLADKQEGIPAVLSWSKDGNYVKLAEVDVGENEVRIRFLSTPGQIEAANFTFNTFTLHVRGDKYVLLARSAEDGAIRAMSLQNEGIPQDVIPIATGTAMAWKGNIAGLQELLTGSGSQGEQPHLLKLLAWGIAASVSALILLVLVLTLLSNNR